MKKFMEFQNRSLYLSLSALTFQDVVLHLWPHMILAPRILGQSTQINVMLTWHRVQVRGRGRSARSRWRGALPSTRAPSTTTSRCSYSLAMSHCSGARRLFETNNLIKINCETQHPASIGWVALSSVVRSVVPHRWHLLSFPLYDVSEHTNHMFSVRIWSWQFWGPHLS